jgi:hypothetical protein
MWNMNNFLYIKNHSQNHFENVWMECKNLGCKSFEIVLLNNFEATNLGKIIQE